MYIIRVSVGIVRQGIMRQYKFFQIKPLATCWIHGFHQEISRVVCGQVGHYHYPLYTFQRFYTDQNLVK